MSFSLVRAYDSQCMRQDVVKEMLKFSAYHFMSSSFLHFHLLMFIFLLVIVPVLSRRYAEQCGNGSENRALVCSRVCLAEMSMVWRRWVCLFGNGGSW